MRIERIGRTKRIAPWAGRALVQGIERREWLAGTVASSGCSTRRLDSRLPIPDQASGGESMIGVIPSHFLTYPICPT